MTDNINPGKLASAKGFANENRLLAALLERGFNASRVDLPHSTYDIVVEQSQDGTIDMIRVQVKTVGKQGPPFRLRAVCVADKTENINQA